MLSDLETFFTNFVTKYFLFLEICFEQVIKHFNELEQRNNCNKYVKLMYIIMKVGQLTMWTLPIDYTCTTCIVGIS